VVVASVITMSRVSSEVQVRTKRVSCVAACKIERVGFDSVRRRGRHNKKTTITALCRDCRELPCSPKIVLRPSSAAAAERFWRGGGGRCKADGRAGGNGGRRSVWRTANQTQKQYIFQAIMLCASEILLRIYAVINCIKQISILLDTEAAFGFHLGPFDTVSFMRLAYRGSSHPSVVALAGGKCQLWILISSSCYVASVMFFFLKFKKYVYDYLYKSF